MCFIPDRLLAFPIVYPGVDLRESDLRGANLSGANMVFAMLDRADLRSTLL